MKVTGFTFSLLSRVDCVMAAAGESKHSVDEITPWHIDKDFSSSQLDL